MSKFKQNKPRKLRPRNSKRQELEVDSLLLLPIAGGVFIITLLVIGLVPPLRQSYAGKLVYDQGSAEFLQFTTVAFTSIVVTFSALKIWLLKKEYDSLDKIWIADHIPLDQPNSNDVIYFQERLLKDGSLVALRCARILKAYIKSGDRTTANEFALDDSSFYLSASESSYSMPRILVWAIPLLGFIGTVLGISQAVTGFTQVLKNSGDIEAIKGGIGNVTTSLGLAFDTTLLALFLSVSIMIPLVLVERYESKLLLGIDVFINDKLLPRFKKNNEQLDPETINAAVKGAIKENFPDPKDLVQPAHSYAETAARSLSTGFISEISKVQHVSSQVMAQVNEIRQQTNRDREEFLGFFAQQQQTNKQLVHQIKSIVEEIRSNNLAVANDLNVQTQGISQQLENAARILENKVGSLEIATQKMSDFQHVQQGGERSFTSLENTTQLENILTAVKDNLVQLQPILQQLNKPRRITLVEQDNLQDS